MPHRARNDPTKHGKPPCIPRRRPLRRFPNDRRPPTPCQAGTIVYRSGTVRAGRASAASANLTVPSRMAHDPFVGGASSGFCSSGASLCPQLSYRRRRVGTTCSFVAGLDSFVAASLVVRVGRNDAPEGALDPVGWSREGRAGGPPFGSHSGVVPSGRLGPLPNARYLARRCGEEVCRLGSRAAFMNPLSADPDTHRLRSATRTARGSFPGSRRGRAAGAARGRRRRHRPTADAFAPGPRRRPVASPRPSGRRTGSGSSRG